jgi:hypothetical protein
MHAGAQLENLLLLAVWSVSPLQNLSLISHTSQDTSHKNDSLLCRKVVEHVTLYQMRKELTEEAEKEMLDHLWSLQYKFREMLATSVGRPVV